MGEVERRRNRREGQSPTETLKQLPALVVLERIPLAALAFSEDGQILFANSACADMLGYSKDELSALVIGDIFGTLPGEESAVAAVRVFADMVVDLAHRDGSTVRARMSRSALLRGDDPVALATFQDLTEKLWAEES
jgi:PAS domain S-box-containing protein